MNIKQKQNITISASKTKPKEEFHSSSCFKALSGNITKKLQSLKSRWQSHNFKIVKYNPYAQRIHTDFLMYMYTKYIMKIAERKRQTSTINCVYQLIKKQRRRMTNDRSRPSLADSCLTLCLLSFS